MDTADVNRIGNDFTIKKRFCYRKIAVFWGDVVHFVVHS